MDESLADQPFYQALIPVLDQSLADMFSFTRDMSEQLESVLTNPDAALAEVEQLIEDALGIEDNNAKRCEDQLFGFWLEG